MKIFKGTILKIRHQRNGEFFGMATKDFDSEMEKFYPIQSAQLTTVKGVTNEWELGDSVPCRAEFVTFELASPNKK